MSTLVLNTPFTATDCLLHLYHNARPPKPVLQQGQCLLLALMLHIPMAPIHGCYSMSHGDYKPQSFLQLPTQRMAVIEGMLMECEFLTVLQDGYAFFHHGMVSKKMSVHSITLFSIGSSCCAATQSITCTFTCV